MLEGCFEYPRGKKTRDGWGSAVRNPPIGNKRLGAAWELSLLSGSFHLLPAFMYPAESSHPSRFLPQRLRQICGGFRAEVSGAAQPGHGRTDGRAGGRTGGREDVRLASPSSVFASWEGAPGAGSKAAFAALCGATRVEVSEKWGGSHKVTGELFVHEEHTRASRALRGAVWGRQVEDLNFTCPSL